MRVIHLSIFYISLFQIHFHRMPITFFFLFYIVDSICSFLFIKMFPTLKCFALRSSPIDTGLRPPSKPAIFSLLLGIPFYCIADIMILHIYYNNDLYEAKTHISVFFQVLLNFATSWK